MRNLPVLSAVVAAMAGAALMVGAAANVRADIEVVDRPETARTNAFYLSNRAPLLPSEFITLPLGSVEPHGWLREMLQRQRTGLTGHLGEISEWLQKDDNAWLSKDGKGKYGWEELPYWLKGYIELGYIFNDPKMMAEGKVWIEGALASQRPNGDFGPDQRFDDDGSRDFWANMIMLFCLQSYYDHSHDARVLSLMTRYFKYQNALPDAQFLTHYWQKMRGGDTLQAVYWLYNITGDPGLLDFGAKIHRCTADWEKTQDLPNWHNVNIAEGFREPAEFYLQSHALGDLHATYADFREVRQRYGQVPGGMFGGDENCRPSFSDPRQGVETCGMVEQMLSDEMLMEISGDPSWADNCEDVAFNTYPAAVMPDFSGLRYLTAPNMAVSDAKNHAPGIDNAGPFLMMNPFSARCCQHNHSHGWPYFSKHLWLATPDNGLCAALYSACDVRARVGDGANVRLTEETHYPFDETIRLKIATDRTAAFPLYLRVPEWCGAAEVAIGNERYAPEMSRGRYIRITRKWKNGEEAVLKLPMSVNVKQWTRNHDSVSVNYGPLTFSLKIGERYEREDSTKTAIGDSHWRKDADPAKWPAYEIHPTTPWNYGLVFDKARPEESFSVKHSAWPADDFPFTTEAAPVTLQVAARQIPEWKLDRYGLCAPLQESPAFSNAKLENVTLIPMGAARLRVSAFPVVADGAGAHHWAAPAQPHPTDAKPTASHSYSGDSLEALNDGLEPQSSSDATIPRFTWWDHRGGKEWVQYDFPEAREIKSASVYWYDDTGHGQCRIPESWRLLYREGGEWKPVANPVTETPARDRWTAMKFKGVTTSALRLEAELRPGFSGGILEWQVNRP